MAQIIQNSSLPFVSEDLDIVCALINNYECPAMKDITQGREMATKMHEMWAEENALQKRLAQYTGENSLHWSKHNAADCDFPSLTEDYVRHLTLGKV